MHRTEDQRAVVKEGIDESGLLRALKAFTILQQVRLMPIHDKVDDGWSKSSVICFPRGLSSL